MLQNQEVEEVISICRNLHSRARFCVGVERLQLTCFLTSIIAASFLAVCLAILVFRKSLFNSSVGMAMKFDHKCKNPLFSIVSNLRERRRHVGL